MGSDRARIGRIIWMTAFLLVEGALYAVILLAKVSGPDKFVLRYCSVAAAFLAAVVLLILRRKKEQIFMALAMLFTAVADVFLVLLDAYYEAAVGIFFFAQCLHGIRILIGEKRKIWPSLVARAVLSGAGLAALALLGQWSLLTAFGVLYAAELLMNTVDSMFGLKSGMRFFLSFLGFLLFIGCDLTVGLNGMAFSWGIPYETAVVLSGLTWVFYLPSQVLIVLSSSDGPKLFGYGKHREHIA